MPPIFKRIAETREELAQLPPTEIIFFDKPSNIWTEWLRDARREGFKGYHDDLLWASTKQVTSLVFLLASDPSLHVQEPSGAVVEQKLSTLLEGLMKREKSG